MRSWLIQMSLSAFINIGSFFLLYYLTFDLNRRRIATRMHQTTEKDGNIGDSAIAEGWGVLFTIV